MAKHIKLEARIFIAFKIQADTGLHVGGTNANIEIGGVDKAVIRDVLTNRPYIPGSSLKGKMRSLLEKYGGLIQNQRISQGYIHSCSATDGTYPTCDVCQVFGVPGDRTFGTPTRIVVRDTHMSASEARRIQDTARIDLPYTEVKTEVAIDRVTSAANPRQMERVPAGTVFGPGQIIYTIFSGDECDPRADIARLQTVVTGLQLVEDDYLGGLGTRGSGRVSLHDIEVTVRPASTYLEEPRVLGRFDNLGGLVAGLSTITDALHDIIGINGS